MTFQQSNTMWVLFMFVVASVCMLYEKLDKCNFRICSNFLTHTSNFTQFETKQYKSSLKKTFTTKININPQSINVLQKGFTAQQQSSILSSTMYNYSFSLSFALVNRTT